ncbi:MAG: hypothetical protein CMJ70_10845 [Planctomycetaceae bacterium]|nr:hypothetical protein [Planctomycetaceae bacterium]
MQTDKTQTDKTLGAAFPNRQDCHPTTTGRPHAPDTRFCIGAARAFFQSQPARKNWPFFTDHLTACELLSERRFAHFQQTCQGAYSAGYN